MVVCMKQLPNSWKTGSRKFTRAVCLELNPVILSVPTQFHHCMSGLCKLCSWHYFEGSELLRSLTCFLNTHYGTCQRLSSTDMGHLEFQFRTDMPALGMPDNFKRWHLCSKWWNKMMGNTSVSKTLAKWYDNICFRFIRRKTLGDHD